MYPAQQYAPQGAGGMMAPAATGFNWQGLMSSPMFQAGLSMLASSYTPQGRGGGSILYGLNAYNQAKQHNQNQQMAHLKQQQVQQSMQDAAARRQQIQLATDPNIPEELRREAYARAYPEQALGQEFKQPAPTGAMTESKFLHPEDKKAQQSYVTKARMKPETVVNVGMAKPLKGSELRNFQHPKTGKPPKAGMTHQDLIDGEYVVKTSQPTTEAGRSAMAQQGVRTVSKLKDAVVQNGSVNFKAVAEMMVPGTLLNSQFKDALASNIYLKTGAAATMGEIEAQIDIYKPKLWTSAETAEDMLSRLEEFFQITAEGAGAPPQQNLPTALPQDRPGTRGQLTEDNPATLQSRQVDAILKRLGIE